MDIGAWWAVVHRITKSDATERLHFHFSLSCIGEGNGNPLQCSYLENPRDGGAWWAAVYGVAQSQTRLKQLNSSSISGLFIRFTDPFVCSFANSMLPWLCRFIPDLAFPGGSDNKESACNMGHLGSIPRLGRFKKYAVSPIIGFCLLLVFVGNLSFLSG